MDERLTIARAGSTMHRSYNQMLRLLMVGAIRGGQDAEGRWWIDAADLERFRREHGESSGAPTTGRAA